MSMIRNEYNEKEELSEVELHEKYDPPSQTTYFFVYTLKEEKKYEGTVFARLDFAEQFYAEKVEEKLEERTRAEVTMNDLTWSRLPGR